MNEPIPRRRIALGGFKRLIDFTVVVLFGLLIPTFLLIQAYLGLAKVAAEVSAVDGNAEIIQQYANVRPHLESANEFALFTHLISERSNLRVVVNKQIMKISIIQIGFAVVSIGLMFIILGIDVGGMTGSGEGNGVKFDMAVESTGVLVFLIGATMATAAGVLRNEYKLSPAPGYHPISKDRRADAFEKLSPISRLCSEKHPTRDMADRCFVDSFERLKNSITSVPPPEKQTKSSISK